SGTWRDIDLTLTPAPDGRLAPRAALAGTEVGTTATDTAVRLPISGGSLDLVHPDATASPATASGQSARYPGALSGGRDLAEALTPSGFEETVTVPSAAAPASYTDVFHVPAGVTARAGGSG